MQIPAELIVSKPIKNDAVKLSGRAYVYVRVSSQEQAADGTSLPTQARECIKRLEGMNLTLGDKSNYGFPGVFADPGVSAWKNDVWVRPGFRAMWKVLEPGDTIVILSLDRMFRSLMDFTRSWNHFEKSGVTLVTVVGRIDMRTAVGRLMSHIFGAFAEFKSNLLSQRMQEAHARIRADNEAGIEREGKPVVVKPKPIRQDWVRDLDDERPDSLFAIAEQSSKKGKVYGYVRVSRLEQDVGSQMAPVSRIMNKLVKEGFEDSGMIYEDHVSAFTVNWSERPFGEILWNEVEEGDVIVVARVDRAFRSLRDMVDQMIVMTDLGVHLVTGCGIDTRQPHSRKMLEILAMMAEWESRDISWRSRLGNRYRRMEYGKWIAGPSSFPDFLKCKVVKGHYRVSVNWDYMREVKQVRELVASGMRYEAIAEEMARRTSEFYDMIPIPKLGFKAKKFLQGKQYHKKYPEHQVNNFKEWCSQQRVDGKGEISRRWNKVSISRAMVKYAKIIDRILELGLWGTVDKMNDEEGVSLMKVEG